MGSLLGSRVLCPPDHPTVTDGTSAFAIKIIITNRGSATNMEPIQMLDHRLIELIQAVDALRRAVEALSSHEGGV